MREHPSVPPRSSSLPQVLSRGVGIIGGEGIGTPEWIEGALAQLSSTLSLVTQAQDGELGKAWVSSFPCAQAQNHLLNPVRGRFH